MQTKMDFTAGNVHDSQCFTELLSGTETQVYADSACANEKANQCLAQHNIENRVLDRAYHIKPLTPEQKKRNKNLSPIRSTVERVFGILKLHYGMAQASYIGKARNQICFNLMCVAYNIKHGMAIQRDMRESYA